MALSEMSSNTILSEAHTALEDGAIERFVIWKMYSAMCFEVVDV